MSVERVVPNLASRSLEAAKRFYGHVFGLEPVMDHGWAWGVRRFFVRGPDGHVLNVLSHR